MSKKGNTSAIGVAVAIVIVLVIALIVGSVENSVVFTQSLTSTIGDYVEPLAVLSVLALAGGMGYMAYRKF